ncbi:DEAD/DEAH box helicase, partial [Candidatus Calescamantes bacterium]|nr:DEAD/DEAH box helicase [Candidatus Calescamantes bacterium]
DNPNVFQICTLNETRSELKKRQEIGRGMRLPVNQQGERIQDKNINHLTVIAIESYEDFAKTLQMEIEKDCGVSFGSRIKNKAKRKTVKYRKGFELDDKFKEIWERIKYKTSYKVEYDSSDLIEKAAMSVRRMPEINRAKIKVSKAIIDINKKGISTTPKSSRVVDSTYNIRIPNILFYIEQRIGLTRSTIWEILNSSERSGDILINPQMFLDNAVNAIQDVLFDLMIDGIKYEKFGDLCYEMHLFEDFDIHVNDLTFSVSDKEKTIYKNLLPLDSGVEYEFAQECESREDIEFYFKLPSWFKIKTPIGNYNPDWALIKKNEKTVYFVAETKSAGQELRESEKRKIRCGYAHFNEFENVEYKQVTTVQELD